MLLTREHVTAGLAVVGLAQEPPAGWVGEAGLAVFLAFVLWQVLDRHVLQPKREAKLPAVSLSCPEVIKLGEAMRAITLTLERLARDLDELARLHQDPRSGFSTVLLDPKLEVIGDTLKDILVEMRRRT